MNEPSVSAERTPLRRLSYALLFLYGACAATLNGLGLWKTGAHPFGVYEEIVGLAFVVLALLGFAGRLSAKFVWTSVVVLMLVDVTWRLMT